MSMSPARLLLISVAVTLTACEPRVSLGGECDDEASCSAELACRYGRCRAECAASSDCTSGQICIGTPGVCTLATDDCSGTCEPGLVCAAARCTLACTAPTDCRAGTTCRALAGVSVCLPESPSDAGPPDDAAMLDAGAIADASSDAGAPPVSHRRLSAGFAHACAIRDGRVYCWGNNDANQLGDGLSPSARRTHSGICGAHDCAPAPGEPVRRRSGTGAVELTGAIALASGHHTTCALTDTGIVWCWGSRENGYELGHDGWGTIAEPTIASGATEITVGGRHGCALVGGEWRCWGMNEAAIDEVFTESGVLGSDGPSTAVARPAPRLAGASLVAAGGAYTCGAFADRVLCVGMNYSGELGIEEARVVPTGSVIGGLAHPVEALDAMGHSVCALADGDIRCWGSDDGGILASEALPPVCESWAVYGYRCRTTAEPVLRELELQSERFVGLSSGLSSSACALVGSDRSVVCWGENRLGQAGVTTGASSVGILADRVAVEADGSRLVDVSEVVCGAEFCCARTVADRVFCWGANDAGQLGNGTTDSESFDASVPDGGATAVAGHPRAVEVLFP
jgi:hypothetical protein